MEAKQRALEEGSQGSSRKEKIAAVFNETEAANHLFHV